MCADCVRNFEVNDKYFAKMMSAIRNIEVSAWQRELLKIFGTEQNRNVEVSAWQRCPQREVLLYFKLNLKCREKK
jgi:hypothetical protein